MAALVAGVQYGLSSHSNFHENKSLIFVKLTDSAQRAIEDFLKNRNKTSQNPTIQFLGNEGQLSFPSTQSNHGSAGFTFSLSDNQDIEGPQGGFECIQQTGPKSLESLGALPCKMRIQANDDVYETTRHRMAVAEENNKNKCTRVIKANGPDIGRKVKVKGIGRTIPPPSNVTRYRDSPSIPTSTNHSRLSSSTTTNILSSSFTPLSSSTSSGYKTTAPVGSSNLAQARNQLEKKTPDIARRPLRERLVHILALRPYKKPEIYDRINREGIKERERSVMTTILKQIAYMRDNTYHLLRYVWNEVQDDWPYYTEQEKTMLKRRKPQNLTPPGSSDGGSSGSGQSPNSTHPGSPPAISAPPPSLLTSKRPGYYQGNDGLPTKRPRISHYKKPEANSNFSSNNNNNNNNNSNNNNISSGNGNPNNRDNVRIPGGSNISSSCVLSNADNRPMNGGSGTSGANITSSASVVSGINGDCATSWDQRQQTHNQRRTTVADYRAERTTNNSDTVLRSGNPVNYGAGSCSTGTGHVVNSNLSDSEDNHYNHYHNNSHRDKTTINNSSGSHNNNFHNSLGGMNSGTVVPNRNNQPGLKITSNPHSDNSNVPGKVDCLQPGGNSGLGGSVPSAMSAISNNNISHTDASEGKGGGNIQISDRERTRERSEWNRLDNYSINETTVTADDNNFDNCNLVGSPCNVKAPEYPDYLTYYTTISSTKQRKRYKAEFTEHYEEYRRLHAQITKVSTRFVQLEEQLKLERLLNNTERVRAIGKQIVEEYNETKRDPEHQERKRRFHYLHEKLSHLKRLVSDYDAQQGGGVGITNGSNHFSNNQVQEMNDAHY